MCGVLIFILISTKSACFCLVNILEPTERLLENSVTANVLKTTYVQYVTFYKEISKYIIYLAIETAFDSCFITLVFLLHAYLIHLGQGRND